MQYKYGDAWERFPIRPGEVWVLDNGSRVAVHDIFNPLPDFMCEADLLFVDPPWTQGNLTCFYTKAGRSDYQKFENFTDILFKRIKFVHPDTCYIEIGKGSVDEWLGRLRVIYPYTERWPVVYYRKYPTFILRGSVGDSGSPIDFTGMDESRCIELIAEKEDYRVMGDFCMGRGLVGIAAYSVGKPFVGTELNPRRLANLLQKINDRGGKWKK